MIEEILRRPRRNSPNSFRVRRHVALSLRSPHLTGIIHNREKSNVEEVGKLKYQKQYPVSMKSNALVQEICISDFGKSIQFYTKILGFKIEYQREEEGFAFLSLGKAQIMIDQIDKGRT